MSDGLLDICERRAHVGVAEEDRVHVPTREPVPEQALSTVDPAKGGGYGGGGREPTHSNSFPAELKTTTATSAEQRMPSS